MNVGDKAPEVLGVNEKGERILLSNYRGKKVVLYFYPKDNTSGCTAEACSLRDNYSALKSKGDRGQRGQCRFAQEVHRET